MIYSKRHDFLFIKGRKVASTSVEMALSAICGPDDIITPIPVEDERARLEAGSRGAQNYTADRAAEAQYLKAVRRAAPGDLGKIRPPQSPFRSQRSLAHVVEVFGDLPTDRVVFIARRPYEKVLAWANYKQLSTIDAEAPDAEAAAARLKSKIDRGLQSGAVLKVRNIDLYRRPSGAVRGVLLRYERLDADFEAFVRGLGVEAPPVLPDAAKRAAAADLDLRSYLTNEQIAAIDEHFAEEFDAFEYERLQAAP